MRLRVCAAQLGAESRIRIEPRRPCGVEAHLKALGSCRPPNPILSPNLDALVVEEQGFQPY